MKVLNQVSGNRKDISSFSRWMAALILLILLLCTIMGTSLFALNKIGLLTLSAQGTVFLKALSSYLIATLLALIKASSGLAILKKTGLENNYDSDLERGICGFIIGSWVLTIFLMFLSAINFFNAYSVGLILLLMCIFSFRELFSLFRKLLLRVAAPQSISPRIKIATASVLLVFLGLAVFLYFPILLRSFLPNSDWDGAAYLLPAAKNYLKGSLFNSDPLSVQLSYPGAVSLFYAAFLTFGFEEAVIPYNLITAIITISCVYAIGRRFIGQSAAIWAIFIAGSMPSFLHLAVDPRIDIFMTLYLLFAIYSLLLWHRSPSRFSLLLPQAISINLALGTKYSAIIFSGLILIFETGVFLNLLRTGKRLLSSKIILLFFLFLLFPNGLWYAANTYNFENPIYPQPGGVIYYRTSAGKLSKLKKDLKPYLDRFSKIPGIEEHIRKVKESQYAQLPKHLFNLKDILLHPRKYNRSPNNFLSPLLLLALLFPFLYFRNPACLILFLIPAGYYFLMSFISGGVLRYVLPSLVMSSIMAGAVIARFKNPIWQTIMALILTGILYQFSTSEEKLLGRMKPHLYLSGEHDRISWLAETAGYNYVAVMPPMIKFINQSIRSGEMPANSKILMIGENKGYLLKCDYIPDPTWGMERWFAELLNGKFQSKTVISNLKKKGVTHILFSSVSSLGLATFDSHTTGNIVGAHLAFQFLNRYGKPVQRFGGLRLYEI